MDALPEPPPSYEQVITRKLVECGLSIEGIDVSYQDYLQSYEIVISPSANAAPSMFKCIRDASTAEIVTFEDQELGSSFNAFMAEAYRPQAIASAEGELAKRGRLSGFPRRADFSTDKLFAEGLEQHCGLAKGEVIKPFGDALAFQPPLEGVTNFSTFAERYACILSAIQLVNAKGEAKIGFVGNEAAAAPD